MRSGREVAERLLGATDDVVARATIVARESRRLTDAREARAREDRQRESSSFTRFASATTTLNDFKLVGP